MGTPKDPCGCAGQDRAAAEAGWRGEVRASYGLIDTTPWAYV